MAEVQYSDVEKAVLNEINGLGQNVKANHETMMKNYEDLKKLVDSKPDDVLIKTRIDKLATDISTRQEDLDKKFADSEKKIQDRIDQMEVAVQRPGFTSGADPNLALEEKEAIEWQRAYMSLQNKEGVTWDRFKNIQPNVELYRQYKNGFENFLRKAGDERNLTAEEHKLLLTGSDPDGGYHVPTAMSARIIGKVYEYDPIRQLASVETISTAAWEAMVDQDEAGYGWEGDTVAGAETATPKEGKKRIPVYTLYGKPRATQTYLEDSVVNVENWLADKVGARFARIEGAAFVTGNGVGAPRGFLTYGNGTTTGTIERINMGNASLLTADGFIDVKYHLTEYFLNQSTTWLMARSTVAAAMKLKDGSGDYIWKPSLIATDPYSTILSSPVRMSASIPVVAVGAMAVVIADWKEAYTIIDRIGITLQRDPYTVKPLVEFYFRKRVGGDVCNYDAIKIGVIAV